MSASSAIGSVSASIRNLLDGEMDLQPPVRVTILSPDESRGGPRRLNIYLYKVHENPFLRNQDWQVDPNNSSQLIPPPLSLNLYYLITPFAGSDNDVVVGNSQTHIILGEAMRVLYEHPIIPEGYLDGDLDAAREQIKITQNTLDMEELSQVWSTFSTPFHLSVLYEVSVVQLDQSNAQSRALPPRVREFGIPEIQAAHKPPVVNRVEVTESEDESFITFIGENLIGWHAHVTFQRRRILSGVEITQNQFRATLPQGLAVGFHEVRVDISHLFRRTFAFEITIESEAPPPPENGGQIIENNP